jgi:hypothetical protein
MATTIDGWERVATRRYPDTPQYTSASAHDVTEVMAVTDDTGVSLTIVTATGEVLNVNLFGISADAVSRAIASPGTLVA